MTNRGSDKIEIIDLSSLLSKDTVDHNLGLQLPVKDLDELIPKMKHYLKANKIRNYVFASKVLNVSDSFFSVLLRPQKRNANGEFVVTEKQLLCYGRMIYWLENRATFPPPTVKSSTRRPYSRRQKKQRTLELTVGKIFENVEEEETTSAISNNWEDESCFYETQDLDLLGLGEWIPDASGNVEVEYLCEEVIIDGGDINKTTVGLLQYHDSSSHLQLQYIASGYSIGGRVSRCQWQ